MKIFLLAYFACFFALAFVLPTWRVWKSTGVNPYKLGSSDSVHDYIGRSFRLILIACALIILLFVFWPSAYQQFGPIQYLSGILFVWVGLALLSFAMIWVVVAQIQMQKSWRIGIDEDVRTELVQRGLFRVSRNPIFLGMRLMLLGLSLILPNAIMFSILLAGEILIQIQVRLEEDFLARTHGASYLAYQQQARRWI